MFQQPTVFVLGAGANYELGFPLGSELMSAVGACMRMKGGRPCTEAADDFMRSIRNRFGDEANNYLNAGQNLVHVMPRFLSIDEAMHYLSEDRKSIAVGKGAIVDSILRAERQSKLKLAQSDRPVLSGVEKTWVAQFFSMLLSNLTKGDAARIFENVTIINFNYDRSLEHYLYWALQTEALIPEADAKEIVGTLAIIRPYGSVGPLNWQTGGGVEFGSGLRSIFDLVDGIQTYTEQRNTQIQRLIDQVLDDARLIVILGFGFHRQNLELLGSRQLGRQSRKVYATVRGIARENHGIMRDNLMRNIRTEEVAQFLDKSAAELLGDLRIAIMAAAN